MCLWSLPHMRWHQNSNKNGCKIFIKCLIKPNSFIVFWNERRMSLHPFLPQSTLTALTHPAEAPQKGFREPSVLTSESEPSQFPIKIKTNLPVLVTTAQHPLCNDPLWGQPDCRVAQGHGNHAAQPFHLVSHDCYIFLYLTFSSSSTLAHFSLYAQTCLTFCSEITGETSFWQFGYPPGATIAPRALCTLGSHRPSLALSLLGEQCTARWHFLFWPYSHPLASCAHSHTPTFQSCFILIKFYCKEGFMLMV